MSIKGIKPEDILNDAENFIDLNGLKARKGSIAAFLKNIDIFEDNTSTDDQKSEALSMIKELAPVVVALGLHQHATFKNKVVEAILNEVEC